MTFCECIGEACGAGCCDPGEVCDVATCDVCPTGSVPCGQSAVACGCGTCATSVNNVIACVTETVIACAGCINDVDCTGPLGRPGLVHWRPVCELPEWGEFVHRDLPVMGGEEGGGLGA